MGEFVSHFDAYGSETENTTPLMLEAVNPSENFPGMQAGRYDEASVTKEEVPMYFDFQANSGIRQC
jgi:hypothetical protein